jgi:hypothetical protein
MLRGSKSRNKVSVGEPAEGSLPTSKRVAPQLSGCVCARFFPPHVNLRCVPHSFQHPLQQSTDRTLAHVCVCVCLSSESCTPARMAQQHTNQNKTPNDGYLGSRNDEERSEMRYAVRIAEFSESSEL